MNEQYQKSMQVLLTKLSAVRVTLSDEEQVLLDWLLQGSRSFDADEVVAQSMVNRAVSNAVATDADEAIAQSMVNRAVSNAVATDADEAIAQSMVNRAVSNAVQMVKIAYDPELEIYQVVIK